MECLFRMELTNEPIMNIENFSKTIGQNSNINSDILRNYIFANISSSLIKTSTMKNDISKLYNLDKHKYYEAAKNSTCINHIIITQSTLEDEIAARKVIGILLSAEEDFNLRSKVIKLLRKYYPLVYNSVKQRNLKLLKDSYMTLDNLTRDTEARLHASIYFYFSIYRSAELVDQGCISSIINDVYDYEFNNSITSDINAELSRYKTQINEIKDLIKKKYDKLNSFKDVMNNKLGEIKEYGAALENLFIINNLNINSLFSSSEFINIDKIILSFIKTSRKDSNPETVVQWIINGIFLQSLINEYKKSREYCLKSDNETILFEADALKEKLHAKEAENTVINNTLAALQADKLLYDKNLSDKINSINKEHISEITSMQNKIKELENQLSDEKKYRNELYALREYIFEVNNDYTPAPSETTFENCIKNKKILIIGGTKDWRRKFRDTYPEIRTLHGFNENFDSSTLTGYDYIFFYTGFINHATYYKAMNFIRTHQIKFGYIGKTNVELVKEELMEEIERLE